jgi:TPR repeat protein
MGPRSFVCFALLVMTGFGYWCWDCATLEARATRGDAAAQYRFGKQSLESAKTTPDYAQAVDWIRMAADQGNARAQTALGQLYMRGLGVQRDYSEANKWLHRAADKGAAVAQNELGIIYAKGMGVPQNFDQAIFWSSRAGAQGSSIAKRNLALIQLVKRTFIGDLTTSDGRLHKNVTLQSISPDGITVTLQPQPGSVVLAKLKVENLTGHFKEICGYTAKAATNSAYSQLDSITVRL